MRSFGRIVQLYVDSHSTGSKEEVRRRLAQMAASDLSDLFASHNWRFAERQVDEYLWGTATVTISSVAGALVTITGSTDTDWIDQDIIIPGSTTPHTVSRINTSSSFIISPAYDGSEIASGTSATIRQVRVDLPTNFGSIRDPLLRDNRESRPTSPEEMTQIMRGLWGGGFCHSVQNDKILLWPAQSGRLFYRYKFMPSSPFEYGFGTEAIVDSNVKNMVIGEGTAWKLIPNSGEGTVFESQDNISAGMAVSYGVVRIQEDDKLVLDSEWKSPLDTLFSYLISTDLNMPNYMDQCIRAKAEWRAGKRDESHVYQSLLRAMAADAAIEQRFNRYSERGIAGVMATVTGSRT